MVWRMMFAEEFAVYYTRRRRHGEDMAGEESSPGVFYRIHGKASLPGVERRHTAEKSETPFAASLTARFLRRVLVRATRQRAWKGHVIVSLRRVPWKH
jgi:hypothetical protein